MSLKTAILSNEHVTKAFKKAQKNPDFGFLKIKIDLEKAQFELKNEELSQGDEIKDWEKISSLLEDSNHSYFVVRDPEYEKMFVLVHWAPDQSPLKQRMIYASSRSTLKGFLGPSVFSSDYCLSIKEECNMKRLKQKRIWDDEVEYRNDVEIDKQMLNIEIPPKKAQSSIITQKLSLELSPSAKTSIARYAKGECKLVFFTMSEDRTSFVAEEQKDDTILGIRDVLTETEPRYFIFFHTRSRKDDKVPKPPSARVFVYHCPENCDRSLKFNYSIAKSNFIEACAQLQLVFDAKVELAEKGDFNFEFLDYYVFPLSEEKVLFELPKPPKKKRHYHKKQRKFDVA